VKRFISSYAVALIISHADNFSQEVVNDSFWCMGLQIQFDEVYDPDLDEFMSCFQRNSSWDWGDVCLATPDYIHSNCDISHNMVGSLTSLRHCA